MDSNASETNLPRKLFGEKNSGYGDFDTVFLAYVSLLMIIGIVGNVCVFVVFFLKFKKSNYKLFVLCLSLIDFLMCCFGMPKTIMLIRYNEVFENIVACKIITFTVKFIAGTSITFLFIIALDRYWKVCRPIQAQVYHFHGKIAVGVTTSLTFILVAPALAMYGETKMVNGTTTTSCTVGDDYTRYNKAFEGTHFFIVTAMFIGLIVLYSLIGRQILKSRKGLARKKTESTANQSTFFVPIRQTEVSDDTTYSECVDITTGDQRTTRPAVKTTNNRTYILFLVTAIALCSWVPHFTLESLQASNKHMYDTVSSGVIFIYRTLFFSYYWSTISNPFLYGICDKRFRSEVKTWLFNMFYLCGLKPPRSTTFRLYQ